MALRIKELKPQGLIPVDIPEHLVFNNDDDSGRGWNNALQMHLEDKLYFNLLMVGFTSSVDALFLLLGFQNIIKVKFQYLGKGEKGYHFRVVKILQSN